MNGDQRRHAARRGVPAELAGAPRVARARGVRGLRGVDPRHHLGALRPRARARREVHRAHVPARHRAGQDGADGARALRDARDRGHLLGARHPALAADRAPRGAQPDAAVGHLADAALHRAVPLVSPGDHRDPVREGGGLRRARRHTRAHRRLDRLHRQALRRGDRGDLAEAGRGDPRDRRVRS